MNIGIVSILLLNWYIAKQNPEGKVAIEMYKIQLC